jgi:hypothetical protein
MCFRFYSLTPRQQQRQQRRVMLRNYSILRHQNTAKRSFLVLPQLNFSHPSLRGVGLASLAVTTEIRRESPFWSQITHSIDSSASGGV